MSSIEDDFSDLRSIGTFERDSLASESSTKRLNQTLDIAKNGGQEGKQHSETW